MCVRAFVRACVPARARVRARVCVWSEEVFAHVCARVCVCSPEDVCMRGHLLVLKSTSISLFNLGKNR